VNRKKGFSGMKGFVKTIGAISRFNDVLDSLFRSLTPRGKPAHRIRRSLVSLRGISSSVMSLPSRSRSVT
jgi:hypothetical protein